MGRAGTVIIVSERTCMMGCRCTRTNRSGPPGLGPAVYLTWVLLLAGLALAPPSIALAQASRADDELAEARRLNQEAATLYSSGKLAEAIPLVHRALAIQEKALGPEHPDVAASLDALAGLDRAQGNYREAERLYRRALAIREKALGRGNPALVLSLNNLAGLYRAQGKYAEAEPLYRRALAIEEESRGPENLSVAASLDNLAGLYRAQGKYAQAEPLYRRALAIGEKSRGPEDLDVAASLNNLAGLYHAQGRYAEAEPLYRRALAIGEKTLGPEHPNIAANLNNLALLYAAQGKSAESEPLQRRALAIQEKALGLEHPDVAGVLENFAAFLRKTNSAAVAQDMEARANHQGEARRDRSGEVRTASSKCRSGANTGRPSEGHEAELEDAVDKPEGSQEQDRHRTHPDQPPLASFPYLLVGRPPDQREHGQHDEQNRDLAQLHAKIEGHDGHRDGLKILEPLAQHAREAQPVDQTEREREHPPVTSLRDEEVLRGHVDDRRGDQRFGHRSWQTDQIESREQQRDAVGDCERRHHAHHVAQPLRREEQRHEERDVVVPDEDVMHAPQDELHGGAQDRRVESREGQVELVRAVFVIDFLHAPPRDDDRRLVVPDDGEEERGGKLNALHLGGRGEPEMLSRVRDVLLAGRSGGIDRLQRSGFGLYRVSVDVDLETLEQVGDDVRSRRLQLGLGELELTGRKPHNLFEARHSHVHRPENLVRPDLHVGGGEPLVVGRGGPGEEDEQDGEDERARY